MTPITLARPETTTATCHACGHRISLHGQYLRTTWCIAWDGSTFCGCQTYVADVQP